MGNPPTRDEQSARDTIMALVRAELGEEGWAAAYAAGRVLSLEEAVAEALEEAVAEALDETGRG